MSTALYRRYRPETFTDVIGQDHVTEPLMQALRTGRVSHAYLFSGPRGCGKTTSARILARCLNCAQGPTPTPCGVCDSCVALARDGSGSVDVIEIDAASHGGVEDARDLRERAAYGPAMARYKIYIIDEAHMVTPQGFNALLKIVEEPPEHVKFIFATTQPDKVIGTIRSRTHHYPFRLVPPLRLQEYLAELCASEGVSVAPGVLSFVVRAGGGSVRDSLSVLDQLISGSGDEGLTYQGAAALLGFTEGELLDATIDGLAVGDAGAVFRQIDKVIETGHDPRRFVEDLLERLRDLIVVAAVPDGASSVLRGTPEDQLERIRQQSAAFGPGALSRAADIVNAGLTEMTGVTAPRLQLELICARLLLPGASGEGGYAARLDRLERRLEMNGPPAPARSRPLVSPQPQPSAPVSEPAASQPASQPAGSQPGASQSGASQSGGSQSGGSQSGGSQSAGSESAALQPGGSQPGGSQPGSQAGGSQSAALHSTVASQAEGPPAGDQAAVLKPAGAGSAAQRSADAPSVHAPPASASAVELPTGQERSKAPTPGGIDTDAIRRSWPDILAKIFTIRRTTWTFLSEHTKVLDYDGTRLLLGIQTDGLAVTFRRGQHAELVRQALSEVLGVDAIVEGISTPQSARPGAPAQPGTSAPPATGAATSRDALSPDAVAPGHIFAGAVLPDAVSRDVVSGDAVLPDAVSHDAVSHDGVSAASLSLPAGRPTDSSLSVGLAPTGKPSGSPSDRPSTPMQRARAAVAREASTRGTGSSLLADDSMVSSDDENIEAASVGQPVISRVLGGIVISEHDQ